MQVLFGEENDLELKAARAFAKKHAPNDLGLQRVLEGVNKERRLVVYRADSEVRGIAVFGDGRVAEGIELMAFVHPEHRRKGIGKRMIQAILKTLDGQVPRVWTGNTVAWEFWNCFKPRVRSTSVTIG